jgi:hypothetical protein
VNRLILSAVLFVSILAAGCLSTQEGGTHVRSPLGLKTVYECNILDRASEKIECYHVAGVTAAHLNNKPEAQHICSDIWYKLGANAPTTDVARRAEIESNACFFDIAKILARSEPDLPSLLTICSYISKKSTTLDTKLSGVETNQEMCAAEVRKIWTLQQYMQSHPDSLCNIIFILPLVLVGTLLARRQN